MPSETGVKVCWPTTQSKLLAPIVSEPAMDPSERATAVSVVDASVRTTLPPVTTLEEELVEAMDWIEPAL